MTRLALPAVARRSRLSACRTLAPGAVAAALLGLLPLVLAFAGHRDVIDPNDVRGRLDLRRVTVYGKPRVWSLKTYGGWRARTIWDRGYLLVHFDTFGDARFDYYALVTSTGTRLRAALVRDRARRSDYRVARLHTWRIGSHNAKVKVPLRKMTLPRRRDHFSWKARTLMRGPRCRRTCIDVAPRGRVREPLGSEASPSPTPTPTPT